MNFKEFTELIAVTKMYYPEAKTLPNEKMGLDLWYEQLKECDARTVKQGLDDYVRTNKFPPKLCDFIDFSVAADEPEYMSAEEAWGLVFKAICNGGYHSTEEFAKLPKECQEAVGSPWILKEMATCGIDYVNKTEKYNFLSAYKQIVDKQKKLRRKTVTSQENDKKLTENSAKGKLQKLIDNAIQNVKTAPEQQQPFLELPTSAADYEMPENAKKQLQNYSQHFFGQNYDRVVDMLNKKMQEKILQNLLKNLQEE